MIKKVILNIGCSWCSWQVSLEIEPNKYGFYDEIKGYCPNCFSLLNVIAPKDLNKELQINVDYTDYRKCQKEI